MDRVDYQTLVIQDIVNLESSGDLNLSPWYQRRSVWSPSQKAYLINSLLEQKPIPAIYVRHSIDLESRKSIKEVVDGQQRTRAIIEYYKGRFAALHPKLNKKLLFTQLSRDEQQKFLLTAIPIGFLLGADDADVIDIFGRINSISKSLNSQEKRNAAFSGDMKQFCLREASERVNLWRNYDIFSANDIARMSEVQFMSDVIYNIINGISDFSPKKIDDMYKKYDEAFDDSIKIKERLNKIFDLIASCEPEKIKDTIFKRQPIFFSLIIALNEKKHTSVKKLSNALTEIDSRFNDDDNKDQEDEAFRVACSATTQRITQRKVRHNYITKFL